MAKFTADQVNLYNQMYGINSLPQPKKPKGNLLTSLLPTAGSILGGIAGTVLAPGVGTAAGGAGGALLGTKLRNIFTGQEDKMSDYLMEGGFGALGGIGKAAKSIKGAGTVLKAGGSLRDAGTILRTGQFADDAVKGGASALKTLAPSQVDNLTASQITQMGNTRPFNKAQNLVENLINKGDIKGAQRLTGMVPDEAVRSTLGTGLPRAVDGPARGILRQSTIAPVSTLPKASQQNDLIELTRKLPGMRGSAARKFQNVEGEIGKMTSQVDDLLRNVDTKIPMKDMKGKAGEVLRGIVDPMEAKRFKTEYNNIVRNTFKGGIPKELKATDINQLRRSVNNQLTGTFKKIEKGTQLTDKDEALLKLRDTLGGTLEDLAPDVMKGQVKGLNRNVSTLMSGVPELKKASEEALQIFGTRIPFISQAAPRAFQTGADAVGRGLTMGGSGTIPGLLKAQGARGILTAMSQPQADAAVPETDPTMMASNPSMMGAGADMAGMGMPTGTSPETAMGGAGDILGGTGGSQSMYTREAAAQDIQNDLATTGGANMDKYLKLYEFLNPEPDKKATAAQGQSALVGLEQLQGLFSNAGGGQGLPGFFQKLLGKGRLNTDVEAYEKLRKTVAVPLARAMGEKGPLSDLDIKTWVNALPDVSDSPEAAQSKIQFLAQQLQAMQSLDSGASGGTDASAILSQLGY